MKQNSLMMLSVCALVCFLVLPAAVQAQSNTVYRLQANEEFVYGRIGLNDDGTQQFTFVVVRTPAPDKTVYRRELDGYAGVQSLLRGGAMSVERNVQDYDLYDYFIVFNGNKLGPFDRFKEVQHDNPNVADWISPNGEGLTFTTVRGQRYTLYANSGPQTEYWSHVQVPLIAEAPDAVAFAIQFDRNNWHLRENRSLIKQEYARFWNLEYSADGSRLMYVGAPNRTNERYVYINHERVAGPYTTVMPYTTGFVGTTNTPYFVGYTPDGQEMTVGTRRVDLPRSVRNIGRVIYSNGRLAFSGTVNDRHYTFLYTVSTNHLMQREGQLRPNGVLTGNNRTYLSIADPNENRILVDQSNEVISSIPRRELHDTFRWVQYRVSPRGDIFADYLRSNGQGVILKNGSPYQPAGSNFSRVIHFSFDPVTGDPRIAINLDAPISSENRRIIQNNRSVDITGEMDNFERYSAFPQEGGPIHWVRRRIPAAQDWRLSIYRENERLTDEFYTVAELTVSHDGSRYAALVSRDPDFRPMWYVSTNRVMHQPLDLLVDGRIVNGRFGAPVWSQRARRFLALTQDGRNVVIRQL